jgi:hypothetical protein
LALAGVVGDFVLLNRDLSVPTLERSQNFAFYLCTADGENTVKFIAAE